MDKLQEFWYCVSPQNDIPIYKGETLDETVVGDLIGFLDYYRENCSENISQSLQSALLHDPKYIKVVRLLLGITNKRFYLDMTYLAHVATDASGERLVKEKREDLKKYSTAWFMGRLSPEKKDREVWAKLISTYFISDGLEPILNALLPLSKNVIKQIYAKLIAPKEIQQKLAKYRGHGAEQLLAKSLHDTGANIYPPNKHLTPMAEHDPNVRLSTMEIVAHEEASAGVHSFDLIIKDGDGAIRGLVQSLIHTSDPGQYGVNKSDETVEIRKLLDTYNKKHRKKPVYLIGSVDGVGFCENPTRTIGKMLSEFDSFVQVSTMFKGILYMQQVGLTSGLRYIVLDDDYFSPEVMEYFNQEYIEPAGVTLVHELPDGCEKRVRAGCAWLGY